MGEKRLAKKITKMSKTFHSFPCSLITYQM